MPSAFDEIVSRQFPGAAILSEARLTGGVSADVYRIDLVLPNGAPRSVVVRSHGETHGGHGACLEYDLLASLFNVGLPVPEPLCVDDSGAIHAHPYLMMPFVEGAATCSGDLAETTAAMAKTLATIHRTATATLPRLPLRLDPLEDVLDFLPDGPEWQPLMDRLSGLTDTGFSGPPVLLHGDFWPANLIWSGAEISAVLDWEDAALGDPLSDVACACLELRYLYGRHGMQMFQDAYSSHGSLDPARLALWLIYVAAAAQANMGDWRLDPAKERHMRQTAIATLREAADRLH